LDESDPVTCFSCNRSLSEEVAAARANPTEQRVAQKPPALQSAKKVTPKKEMPKWMMIIGLIVFAAIAYDAIGAAVGGVDFMLWQRRQTVETRNEEADTAAHAVDMQLLIKEHVANIKILNVLRVGEHSFSVKTSVEGKVRTFKVLSSGGGPPWTVEEEGN
jgi:hypothetical protein